jgi:tetratricopeptide (TPR) repeat protein
MTTVLIALWVTFVSVIAAMPLASHSPEARTPEEFDLYLEFHEAVNDDTRHEIALRFERAFPESELLLHVYRSEFEYARSHEQHQAALASGEKLLRLAPDDPKAPLGLAEILPYGTNNPQTLSRAEQYARQALAGLNEMRLSREVTRNECDKMQKSLLSRAHAARAYVLGKRGDIAESIRELEAAISLSPEPVGAQLLFAGKLYRTAKRERDAIEMFQRAAQAGPAGIKSLAEAELRVDNQVRSEAQP